MIDFIVNIFSPSHYHGNSKKNDFFEGWFYKLVDSKGDNVYAIIPGVFISNDKTKEHSFIQILNGKNHESHYCKFSFNEFQSKKNKFEIEIGNSIFNEDFIKLEIERENISLKGKLHFDKLKPWPITLFSPGIMGWYSYVPYMECNHGVISLNHSLSGILVNNQNEINFEGGKGYIEKDWGSSFPSSYVWVQSNHFEEENVSFTGSVARIPWRSSWFRGFIAGLLIEDKLYRFATYTGAKLHYLCVDEKEIKFEISDRKYKIQITAERTIGGQLHAPYENEMLERVSESLDGKVKIILTEKRYDKILFNGSGLHAGIEANGNLDEIVDK